MKLRTSRKIQSLVDLFPSHDLLNVADLVIAAEGEVADHHGSDAHGDGIEDGLELATQLNKKAKGRKNVNIFWATQEVEQPNGSQLWDRFYFIGTEKEIIKKL